MSVILSFWNKYCLYRDMCFVLPTHFSHTRQLTLHTEDTQMLFELMNKWMNDVSRSLIKTKYDAEFIKSLRFSRQSWNTISYIHNECCLACVASTWLLKSVTLIPSMGLYCPSPLLAHIIIIFCHLGVLVLLNTLILFPFFFSF